LARSSGAGARRSQAAVLDTSGRPLQIRPLQLERPREDEILIRMVASGICRTDIDVVDDWVVRRSTGAFPFRETLRRGLAHWCSASP